MTKNKIQTTLRLPKELYDQAQKVLERETAGVSTLNDLVILALATFVKGLRRKQIDSAFAGMSRDRDYLREAEAIAEEFVQSDWEAFQVAERKGAA